MRSAAVLMGGTAAAQLLGALALPILTRIYSPEDFSILAVYASLLGLLSVIACLRFEIAIPLPEGEQEAVDLLLLCLCSTLVVSLLVAFVVLFWGEQLLEIIRQPRLAPYIWTLPVAVCLAGVYSGLQYWATRKRWFLLISKTRFSQVIAGTGIQIGLGLAGASFLGLLAGQIANSGAGIVSLARMTTREQSGISMRSRFREMVRVAARYKRFPKYSTPEALANAIGIQLPVIAIAALSIGPEAGYLMLAVRAVQIPMGLVGGAVSQVYLAGAPEKLRSGTLAQFTVESLRRLGTIGIGPLILIGAVSPVLFGKVFGTTWYRAGEIVAWMLPWIIFQLISSPISMVMHVCGRQRLMLFVTITGLAIRMGGIFAADSLAKEFLSECYALSGGLFYMVCFFVFSRVAGLKSRDYFSLIRAWAPAMLISALGGLFLNILVRWL